MSVKTSSERQAKLKQRSSRAFTKAYMLNKQYEKCLQEKLKGLDKLRNAKIRESKEQIWKIGGKGASVPRLPRPDDVPSYIDRPKSVTLPTPNELQSLLPKKVVRTRSKSVCEKYNPMSRRRLSHCEPPDIANIKHFQHLMGQCNIQDDIDEESGPTIHSGSDIDGNNGVEDTHVTIHQQNKMSMDSGYSDRKRKLSGVLPPATKMYQVKHDGSIPTTPNTVTGVRRNTGVFIKGRVLSAPPSKSPSKTNRTTRIKSAPGHFKTTNDTSETTVDQDDLKQRRLSIQAIGAFQFASKRLSGSGFVGNVSHSSTSSQNRRETSFACERRHFPRRFGSDLGKFRAKIHEHAKELGVNMDKLKESIRKAKQDELDYLNMFDEMKYCRYLRWGRDEKKIEDMLANDARAEPDFHILKLNPRPSIGFSKAAFLEVEDVEEVEEEDDEDGETDAQQV